MTELVFIKSSYTRSDSALLYDHVYNTYDKVHVSIFQSRKSISLPGAIALARELPRGAFIAGGFAKSFILGDPVKDYDIYFNSPATLIALVNRIHNAPPDTALHGYESDESVRSFATSTAKYINFTHPTKPPLQLIRIRWFDNVEQAIDKFDFRMCQFALDADLTMTYLDSAINDVRAKQLVMYNPVFKLSTSFRLKRFMDNGWSWMNGHYDSYTRNEMLRLAESKLRSLQRAAAAPGGALVPALDEGYGNFE